MTGVKVIDASALAAMIFCEPEAAHVATLAGSDRLIAPTLLGFELANICWKKLRRYPKLEDKIKEAYAGRDVFGVEQRAVDFDATLRLALRTGLTAYDASYLWLARSIDVPLLTLDRRLLAAAVG